MILHTHIDHDPRSTSIDNEDNKWQCVVGINFIVICQSVRCCKFYPKLRLASGFTLTKSTRMVTLQDVSLLNITPGRPYATAEMTISVQVYPENYQKLLLQTSFSWERLIVSPRYFPWQFRKSSPLTYFKNVFILLTLVDVKGQGQNRT